MADFPDYLGSLLHHNSCKRLRYSVFSQRRPHCLCLLKPAAALIALTTLGAVILGPLTGLIESGRTRTLEAFAGK